ncbi:MAG: hypothetical protein GF317_05825 [Candidatus Lokiarchaeota archaeon]|nr:hypothetical protein [Candidatus Lokiarchaeota archaeon]
MGRPRKDLSYLTNIGVIKDFLKENTILPNKKIRRYLLDLAVIYPYIIKAFNNKFEGFLELDKNKKAFFFHDFIEKEFEKRMKLNPRRNRTNTKNRVLQIVWNTQGFLGYLSRRKDLKANPKLIELQTPNPSFINKINIIDVYDLYEVLPDAGRRRLKLQLFCGYNNVDLVQLRLSDFKPYRASGEEFFYIHKQRQKTARRRINYLNVFDDKFVFEYERFCNRYDIKENELLFPVGARAISAMYKRYIMKSTRVVEVDSKKKKVPLINPHTTPKYIRQLCFTQLEDVFHDDDDLFMLWSQHALRLVKKHYIKNYLDRFIKKYDKICDAVLLGNTRRLTLEKKQLKQDIYTKFDLLNKSLNELKLKVKDLQTKPIKDHIKDVVEDTAKQIMKSIDKKLVG